MTFICPALSGAIPVLKVLVTLHPRVYSYLSHSAVSPRRPPLLTHVCANLSTCFFHGGTVTLPTMTDCLYVLICCTCVCFIFPAIVYIPFKSTLLILKEGILETTEYTHNAQQDTQQRKLLSCLKLFCLLCLQAAWC